MLRRRRRSRSCAPRADQTPKPLPVFFFSSRRRHTRCGRDWSSDVCSSDLLIQGGEGALDYGLVEQAGRLGRVEQRIGLAATAGLTEQGDVARITTKGGDIVLQDRKSVV